MSGLFSQAQIDQINAVAAKSRAELKPVKSSGSISSKQKAIDAASRDVLEYFKDSPAILINTREDLHNYILKAIEVGYCGIDTETTGLDKVHDTIVGFSLYYPGGVECYIPSKHRTLVETYYKNQLSYEDIGAELQLFVEAKTKMIFANADYDLAMIYKDFGVDMIDICYYDVILAWRCLKEDEPKNDLKTLYWKYPNKGNGSPKKFSDFFDPKLFPYSQPEIAKLYAANDAKITYLLFAWQLPFITKSHPKCQKHHLEKIADLIWNIEFPMIKVCALMHRYGLFLDLDTSNALKNRYHNKLDKASAELSDMVQKIIDQSDAITVSKSPFKSGKDFNNSSNPQTLYLFNKFLGMDLKSCDKETLSEMNNPIAKQILKVRSADKLIGTFIDKMPEVTGGDGRVHSTFKSVGADSGRMSSVAPNVQNIPSHATDIRHQFRATPAMNKLIDTSYDDSTSIVRVSLSRWDSVTTTTGKKLVENLVVGDIVKLRDTGKDVWLSISSILLDDMHPSYKFVEFDSAET